MSDMGLWLGFAAIGTEIIIAFGGVMIYVTRKLATFEAWMKSQERYCAAQHQNVEREMSGMARRVEQHAHEGV